MAKTNSIDTPTKRKKLAPRPEPYWHKITKGRHIGYRKTETGGSWIARLTDSNYQKQYKALNDPEPETYDEAVKAAQAWFDEISTSTRYYTLKQCVSDYVAHLKSHNPKTAAAPHTKQRLEKHLPDNLLEKEVTSIKTAAFKLWRDSMLRLPEDPEAPSPGELESLRKSQDSANRVLSMLKAALNLAYQDGHVASDREWRRVKAFKNVTTARKLFLTDAQVKRLLDKTEGSLHTLINAGVLTGARYGELAGAKVKDFDAKQQTLTVSGKTGERVCHLSKAATAFFSSATTDRLPEAFLLVKDDGTTWGKNHHSRDFKAAVKRAKLPRDAVFYSLRHYHISKALLARLPILMVAQNTGTSVKMIEQNYGKFLKTDRSDSFDKVELA